MGNRDDNNAKQRQPRKLRGGITGKGFLPGMSGNPKGRPHTRGLLNALKAALAENTPDGRTFEQALAGVLVEEALHGKHRLAAVTAIFDRLEGKPRQSIEMKQPVDLCARSDEDLMFCAQHGYWPEEVESPQSGVGPVENLG